MLRKFLPLVLLLLVPANPAAGQTSTLITLNIRYDNPRDDKNNWLYRRDKIVELVMHYEPAIFGIQEGLLNQVEFMDSSLSEYAFTGIGREDGKNKGEFCAVFYDTTKYFLIKDSTFWLSENPDTISIGWDAALERICTYGLFECLRSKKRIWVFNTHFDHQGNLAREKSAELVLGHIRRVNTENIPVILMGDLNAEPGEKPIEILKSGLTDALEISGKPFYGPVGTFNGFTERVMDRRIDYIFTQHLDVLSYVHIDDRLDDNRHISDHLPVMITINLDVLPSVNR
jgi:endonuclease/exonuclease/phosphatase family metal-dependent hydrolase